MKNPLQKRCHLWKPMFYCNGSLHFQSIYTYYTHILFRILRTSFDRGDFWMNSVGYVLSLSVISLEKNKDLKDDALKLSNILRVLDWVFTTEIFNIYPRKQWLGGGFKYFFMFTPICGRFPIWLILFIWVETTNQMTISIPSHACFWSIYLEYWII